jgi:16S rRNA (uracil1498-N3)-methyltransferase
MRALYLPSYKFVANQLVSIEGDALHHLQVVRVKKDEEVLLLNGIGASAQGRIVEIQKKQALVQVNKVETKEALHEFSLAIGVPKKDAFEDILKMATELGIRNIYPLTTEYSQYEYAPTERVQKILESALVQSNNLFMPTIHPQVSLEHFLENFPFEILFLNSRQDFDARNSTSMTGVCALVGPEGGFSIAEEQKLISMNNVKSIHLATPILRAPTAVASAIGYLLACDEFHSK